ncbi:hypothetical protein [Sinorhizobium meliloti]|uniref:hypothetical protein n=1 Tax=Rhizobium meliloti TaxID=382 RepID=UPI000FD6E928|nr:hypothetical protein [Sinorhizobium meliloti]RVM91458.1 hypothetical protein CN122_14770 [Sinorhizobium meliloti]
MTERARKLELTGSELLEYIRNPDGWESEAMARIREHKDFYRNHGYCESDIEALVRLKFDLNADKCEGWSSQPSKKV